MNQKPISLLDTDPRQRPLRPWNDTHFLYLAPATSALSAALSATIRKYLTTDATVKMVISIILSRLDYCNFVLNQLNFPLLLYIVCNALKQLCPESCSLNEKKTRSPLCCNNSTGYPSHMGSNTSSRDTHNHIRMSQQACSFLSQSRIPSHSLYQPSLATTPLQSNLKLNIPHTITKLKTADQRSFSFQAPDWNSARTTSPPPPTSAFS